MSKGHCKVAGDYNVSMMNTGLNGMSDHGDILEVQGLLRKEVQDPE
jgi:hypothetical protein